MHFAIRVFPLVAVTLSLGSASAMAQENNQPPAGFVALFNGKDLTGWYGGMTLDPRKQSNYFTAQSQHAARERKVGPFDQHWRVENGELVNDGKGMYATTAKDYGDIELWVDYKTVPLADSGIYLRATPQVQIWDHNQPGGAKKGADKGSGGLWNNSPGALGKDPLVLADMPFGEWNRFHIRQVADITWVWLNDKLVVDAARMESYWDRSLPLVPAGPIQLQTHGGEIRWRNIFVREIPAEEAIGILRGTDPEGFVSIFNGTDLTGWAGRLENYEVVDGALRCKAGKGGVIHTTEEYDDFVVRLEFKLPPRGNNGLAIRFPGGDVLTSYFGMCEIQISDSDNAPANSSMDPRQANGSAYGMIPALRGYSHPQGEWNYQEVTVKGSTIKVELNGVTILNGDLAKVTHFLADKPHPGKDRTSGYFGFAGHNDPVEFRNISIKRL